MQNTHTHLSSRTAIALAALAVSPLAQAGDGYYGGGGLAAQELIRRQQSVNTADELLVEGRKAYAEGDYETAVAKYREALNLLPYGDAAAERRHVLTKHLEDGSVALAQQYRRTGKYEEARGLLDDVIEADPGNVQATKHLEYLDDPIRTNPALTYDHTQNVDRVRRSLYRGEGFYNLGQYDEAIEEFQSVLRIDPYNKA
ncbi:MAG: tetratricopeptide repeat protein, partial [Verrucomicrobiales bacterium]